MARHHFVPQFLLRNWADDKGRLVAYYWQPGARKVIENPSALVTSACQIENLNNFFGVAAAHRDFPETGFFTPVVDTPAAEALRVMLAEGVRALSGPQRLDWARLLVSLGVRTPETLLKMGPEETRKAFALVEASAKGPAEAEAMVTRIIDQNMKKLERNMPRGVAMDLATDVTKLRTIGAMKWWVRRWDADEILIGDRPLLTHPRQPNPCGIPLDHRDCLITLPIAPNSVFFASANAGAQAKLRNESPSRVATVINEETIRRSVEVVYARGRLMASFVIPRLEAKAAGTWPPV